MTEENNVEMQTENVDFNNEVTVGEHLGQVQWFNKKKGFGFIKNVNEPESNDVFFHFSDIQSMNGGYKIVFPGEFISMDLDMKDNKPICKNIRGVGGLPLLTDNEKFHFKVIPKRNNQVSQ